MKKRLSENFHYETQISGDYLKDKILSRKEEEIKNKRKREELEWILTTGDSCRNREDFVSFEEAKALYEKLDNKERKFVTPKSTQYFENEYHIFRIGEYDKGKLVAFLDCHCFPIDDEDEIEDELDDILVQALAKYDRKYINVIEEAPEKEAYFIIVVDPNYRGKGLAKKLLKKGEKKAEKLGFDYIAFEPDTINYPALNFISSNKDYKRHASPNYDAYENCPTVYYVKRITNVPAEEDEMTVASTLGACNFGGALDDDLAGWQIYAPGDMRIPQVLGPVQKRKKKS